MRTLLICILLPCCVILGIIPCKSQSYVKVPRYMDMDVSKTLIDSLQRSGTTNFIIYQTINKDSLNLKQRNSSKTSNMVTYIFWSEKSITKIILITDNCLLQNCIKESKIFSFRDLNRLWLRKDEDIYKIVPDYAEPYDKDIVIFITPDFYRFFEIGRNTFYRLNRDRNKYRNEFISLLEELIIHPNMEWEKISSYNRDF